MFILSQKKRTNPSDLKMKMPFLGAYGKLCHQALTMLSVVLGFQKHKNQNKTKWKIMFNIHKSENRLKVKVPGSLQHAMDNICPIL